MLQTKEIGHGMSGEGYVQYFDLRTIEPWVYTGILIKVLYGWEGSGSLVGWRGVNLDAFADVVVRESAPSGIVGTVLDLEAQIRSSIDRNRVVDIFKYCC